MRTTARSVADACGVSVTTVNEILGGRGGRYRAETKAAVTAAAERLGYRRHGMASAVRTGQFKAVALLNASDDTSSQLRPDLIWGITDALDQAGYLMQLARLPSARLECADPPRLLAQWCSDGLLVNTRHPIAARFVEHIHRHGIPSVWLNHDGATDSVRPDDAGAVGQAVAYLRSAGHAPIAWVDPVRGREDPQEHFAHEVRRTAFLEASCGPVVEGSRRSGPTDLPDLVQAFLASGATACVTPDPQVAAQVLHQGGAAAPAVVVLHDEPVTALGRTLPTLVLPQRGLGEAAVAMLLRRIAGAPPQPAEILPFTLALP